MCPEATLIREELNLLRKELELSGITNGLPFKDHGRDYERLYLGLVLTRGVTRTHSFGCGHVRYRLDKSFLRAQMKYSYATVCIVIDISLFFF